VTDTLMLELYIKKKGYTKKEIAALLGLSFNGFMLKVNNVNEFKASEIKQLCEILDLKDTSIFFKDKVNQIHF
jgi:transcriptional regulator with XRE-family HTH domain